MRLGPLPAALALASLVTAQIPGVDMAVMKKWSDAKVIRYHIAGTHSARTSVVHGDYEAKADVTDRLTLEFTWDVKTRKIIGDLKLTDAKSEAKNLKSDNTNCPPPTLSGDYEHFTASKHTVTPGRDIQIEGLRSAPPAKVSNYPAGCSMRSIPGGTEPQMLFVNVIEPRILGMPIQSANQKMVVAPDRKSITIKGASNWVWVYTPSVVQ